MDNHLATRGSWTSGLDPHAPRFVRARRLAAQGPAALTGSSGMAREAAPARPLKVVRGGLDAPPPGLRDRETAPGPATAPPTAPVTLASLAFSADARPAPSAHGSALSAAHLLAASYSLQMRVAAPEPAAGRALSAFEVEVAGLTAFAAGTRIATASGETAIEKLRLGESVRTLGGLAPVIWLGRRIVDLAAMPGAAPVLIRAGALSDGMPKRDLLVSPDHGLFLDNGLVPARLLLNGGSVVLAATPEPVAYYHVELPTHAIVLAEGLPCESWRETGRDGGTRALFENAFAPAAPPAATDAAGMPLLEGGAALDALRARIDARARLDARARASGIGADIVMTVAAPGRHRATLPPGAAAVLLVSRAGQNTGDQRRLGVAVTAVAVDGVPLALDDRIAAEGFHAPESNDDGLWRWTDGRGRLSLGSADRSRTLDVWVHQVHVPSPR